MRLPLLIAQRYLFSRKQKSVINIISWISLIGIGVCTLALVVVLSVYNGIGALTQSLFNSFDPELIVQPDKGKTFRTSDMPLRQLSELSGVECVSQLVEENAWLTYRHNEAIVQLRGVDEHYPAVTGLDTLLHEGTYLLRDTACQRLTPDGGETLAPSTQEFLILGAEVYYRLGIRQASNFPIAVHIPKRGTALGMTMEEAFNSGYALPAANFYIQQDIDERYVVAHIDFVRQLMDYAPDECTALALKLQPGAKASKVQRQAEALLNADSIRFSVKDRFQQQPLYYKVFRSERLGIYLILALIVLIATLSLVASLTLLILDKRHDIQTLKSMGMTARDIRRAFRIEGLLISAVGAVSGLLLGFVICFLQQEFGIVKMGSNFVVSAFPVAMRAIDFLLTFLMVMSISAGAVALAVRRAKI